MHTRISEVPARAAGEDDARAHAPEDAARGAGAGERRAGWLATGGVLGALGASSCCIVPVALFSLGAGGAWIGALTSLAPYQPVFVAISLGFIAYGFHVVRRQRRAACADGAACAARAPGRAITIALWIAAALLAAAIAFPFVAPTLLGTA